MCRMLRREEGGRQRLCASEFVWRQSIVKKHRRLAKVRKDHSREARNHRRSFATTPFRSCRTEGCSVRLCPSALSTEYFRSSKSAVATSSRSARPGQGACEDLGGSLAQSVTRRIRHGHFGKVASGRCRPGRSWPDGSGGELGLRRSLQIGARLDERCGHCRIDWPEDQRWAPRPLRRWTSDPPEQGRSSFIAHAASGWDVSSPRSR